VFVLFDIGIIFFHSPSATTAAATFNTYVSCTTVSSATTKIVAISATFVTMFHSASTFIVTKCVFMNRDACFPSWSEHQKREALKRVFRCCTFCTNGYVTNKKK
jgi:hypothetical protein